MQLKSLNPNAKNPRKISAEKLDALKKSLAKYGDLSGFVYNIRTKTLVSGHQRQKSLPPDAKIKIEVKHDAPTEARTVAEGYVQIGSERFKYREVDADPAWEMEALLAANKHGGDWDTEKLRLAVHDIPGIDLKSAGFTSMELGALNIKMPEVKIDIPLAKVEEESDEEYVANTEETEERIPTESIDTVNRDAFEDVKEEKTNVVGKRFVIIIDCSSAEHKEALKEKIQSEVIESGGKFF